MTDLKRLNIGSGLMLKKEYINFDCVKIERGGLSTDVIDDIHNISSIFPSSYFEEIICFHVIEHFYFSDAVKLLCNCFNLLQAGGKMILEGPCVLGMYWLYHEQKPNTRKLIEMLYGCERHRISWGEQMTHKWGWTGDIAAEEMEKVGFEIVHVGIGLSHGMGKRDFRVEGIRR